jgi:thiamine biosynthesis lipoprotein
MLERAIAESGLKYLSFTREECLVSKRENILLDTGAFGKGEALYRVRIHSNKVDSDPWLVNLGGQIAVQGLPPGRDAWEVDISFPSDRERPYTTVKLVRGSLATSGNSEKGNHILDPRTGRPSSFYGAVTVWHDDALYADALSTALHVMGPEPGIEWADRHGIAVCFLSVSESGHVQVRQNRFFDPLVSP